MKPKGKELECQECTNIFTIKTASKDPVSFCPFCGEDIIVEEDFDEEDEDLEDDYIDLDEEEN